MQIVGVQQASSQTADACGRRAALRAAYTSPAPLPPTTRLLFALGAVPAEAELIKPPLLRQSPNN